MRPFLLILSLTCAITLIAPKSLAQSKPQSILIDTDIGDDIDDAFAIALALRSPQFRVLGITTTFGDTALRAHLTMRLLEAAHSSQIPVLAGEPTAAKTHFGQAPYAKADTHKLSTQNAAAFITDQTRKHPGQITLIAIGPLMNIGAAIDRDPEGFRKLKRVVVMGGSIDRGYRDKKTGVISPTPAREWNTRNDPASARKLLASGVPVFLMPLDSTQIELPQPALSKLFAQPDTLSHALAELTHEANRKVILYDAVTVAFARNPSLCPVTPIHIDVDDQGYTRRTPGKPNASVCLSANEPGFLQLLTNALTTPTATHK